MLYRIRNVDDHELFWSRDQGWTNYDAANVFNEESIGVLALPAKGEWCMADPIRVVIEVSGGCVTDVTGAVEYVICDWDSIKEGDTFALPDGWAEDPTLADFVKGGYEEVLARNARFATMSDEAKASYLKLPSCCPYCKSSNITADFVSCEDAVTQRITCRNCNRSWKDVLRVVDVIEDEDGTSDEVPI